MNYQEVFAAQDELLSQEWIFKIETLYRFSYHLKRLQPISLELKTTLIAEKEYFVGTIKCKEWTTPARMNTLIPGTWISVGQKKRSDEISVVEDENITSTIDQSKSMTSSEVQELSTIEESSQESTKTPLRKRLKPTIVG
ncbi:hypothetical protein [Crucivirus-539]|nr:hypothetical protein [Crucivirus-539]